MRHRNDELRHLVDRVLPTLLLCACLLVPASALAYGGGGGGGGGGDVGSSSGGGGIDFGPFPSGFDSYPGEIGIEGVFVEPPPGYPGSGYVTPEGKPTTQPNPEDSPWNSKGYKVVEDIVVDQVKDKVLEAILVGNPQLLATVKVVKTAYGIYVFTKESKAKLEQAKKDYQKALIGNMGSNLQMPDPEIPEMNPYASGGGGPQEAMDSNYLQ